MINKKLHDEAMNKFRQWYLNNKNNLDDDGFIVGLNEAAHQFVIDMRKAGH